MSERTWELLLAALLAGMMVFGCQRADAKDVAELQSEVGRIVLTDEAWICMSGAKRVVWTSADRTRIIPGCYSVAGLAVRMAFLDGDPVTLPAAAFSKVEDM